MEVKIPYANITDKNEGYQKAKKIIPEVIEKFGVTASVDYNDAATTLKAQGSGFKATIIFDEAFAQLKLDLGLLLKPFKGKILETIEKQIKKIV